MHNNSIDASSIQILKDILQSPTIRLVKEFNKLIQEFNTDNNSNFDYVSRADPNKVLYEFLKDADFKISERLGPILAEIFGADPNPWPDLVLEDVYRMTKGRVREAEKRGIHVLINRGKPVTGTPTFMYRLAAEINRDWLEGSRR